MTAIKNEKNLKNAISGFAAHDSRSLEKIFEICRTDEKKMTLLLSYNQTIITKLREINDIDI